MAICTLVLSGLFAAFLILTSSTTSQTNDYEENDSCSCEIPGTKLYADVYYDIRIVSPEFAGWPLTYSTPTEKLNGMVAVDPSKNGTYLRDGHTPTAMHWQFVETELPGWYYLQNRNHPDKYITWGKEVGDKLLYSAWRLVLDPNFAEDHNNRMDFFVRPYRPRGVNVHQHQIKFKNRPIAVVTWSWLRDDGNVPIELDLGDQQQLKTYEPINNQGFEYSLFEFREVKENKKITSSTGGIDTFSWPPFTFLFCVVGLPGGILTIF